MPYLNEQMPDLSQMFGDSSVMPTMLGLQQIARAKQAQAANLQTLMQQNQMARERAPIDLAHIAAQTEQARAQIPFMQQQTEALRLKNEESGMVPLDQRKQAAISKLATQMTEDQLKQKETEIVHMSLDPNTPEPVRARLMKLRDLFPAIYAEQQKQKLVNRGHEAVANIQGNTAREVEKIGATSRENVAKTRASSSSKNPKTYQARAAMLREEARTETDPDRKKALIDEAEDEDRRAQYLIQAAAGAVPQLDTGKVPDAPLSPPKGAQIVPRRDLAPTKENAAKLTNPKLTQEDLDALRWAAENPNDPRAKKIKEKLGVR